MRLKSPPQPLVFCFSGVSPLCGAVAKLYDIYPEVSAYLCLNAEKYYLAVYASLAMRRRVFSIVMEYGSYLGPGSVKYSFYEEHGQKITHEAVAKLGAALKED